MVINAKDTPRFKHHAIENNAGHGGIAPRIPYHIQVSGHLHAPVALPPGKKPIVLIG